MEHANRPSSTVLTQKSSPVRFVEDVNCGTHQLKGTQPQLIPKKSTEYKSNREPSMKNAQHNTHTHETEKLGVSWKPVNLNLGNKYFYLLLFSGTALLSSNARAHRNLECPGHWKDFWMCILFGVETWLFIKFFSYTENYQYFLNQFSLCLETEWQTTKRSVDWSNSGRVFPWVLDSISLIVFGRQPQ